VGTLVRAGIWRGGRAGLIAGTLYFLLIAILTFFGAALGSGTVSLLWLVLFLGAGAGLGLLLGALAGAVVAAVLHRGRTQAARRHDSVPLARERVVGSLVAGATVLALCIVSNVTGIPGVLTPEPMTSLVLPTVVALWVGATTPLSP